MEIYPQSFNRTEGTHMTFHQLKHRNDITET